MTKTKKKTSKRKPNPAFMRPVQPDDKLAAIVGSQPLPRTELTKKLWNYSTVVCNESQNGFKSSSSNVAFRQFKSISKTFLDSVRRFPFLQVGNDNTQD